MSLILLRVVVNYSASPFRIWPNNARFLPSPRTSPIWVLNRYCGRLLTSFAATWTPPGTSIRLHPTTGLHLRFRESGSKLSDTNSALTMADPKSIGPDPDSLTPDALTEERFYAFLQRLHLDPDQAALKYEELHGKLVKFFEWSSCVWAEDLADETLNRTARKLRAGDENILNVEAFIWGVAKHIRQEARRKESRTVPLSEVADVRLASSDGGSFEAIHSKMQRQNERQCLHACLGRLAREEQELARGRLPIQGLVRPRRRCIVRPVADIRKHLNPHPSGPSVNRTLGRCSVQPR